MSDSLLAADSLYGNLLGAPFPLSNAAGSAPVTVGPELDRSKASADRGKRSSSGDDMFADAPKDPAMAGALSAADAAREAGASPASSGAKGAELNKGQLPSTFTAAKLMMPPVRKKAEPMGAKRPVVALDIQKLQAEKEALLRQRASASEKKEDAKPAGTTASATRAAGSSAAAPPAATSAAAAGDGEDAFGAAPSSGSTAPSPGAAASSMSLVATSSLYGSPDEEYDPAKPNDYDDFCRRRLRQKAEEEMERRRQETSAKMHQLTAGAGKAPEPKEDDFATRMMKKMGWKEGSGLGKEGQGMATPLVMKKTDTVAGVITEGQKRESSQSSPAQPPAKQAKAAEPKAAASTRPPTTVLLLNNLVGAGEVDEDLEEETAEEAGKYGKLKKCVVREIKGVPDTEAVRIFLEYEKVEDATKALVDMNGRYFGGRVVRARFYDEARFAAGDLDKRDDD